jgi:hypothetical protein
MPFVPSLPQDTNTPVLFTEALQRATTAAGKIVPDALPTQVTYTVAAQDIFGRWSTWAQAHYTAQQEPSQTPSVVAIQMNEAGANTTVDFGWDWSDRSPEFIEIRGIFEDQPGTVVLSARLQFGGAPQPADSPFNVIPLDQARVAVADFGAPQDCVENGKSQPPGQRLYRLTTAVPLDFAGRPSRTFSVSARGQCHVHNNQVPGFNVSLFGPPKRVIVFDPAPPVFPISLQPETPLWASLPDVTGVSRFLLSWPGNANVKYVVWETTETTVLNESGRSPDLNRSLAARLADLRTANLGGLQQLFRRVRERLIEPGVPITTFEVALPAGSSVIHLYAVTAVSANQQESGWPTDSRQFFAVAVPRLAVPAPPGLEATAASNGQPAVNLQIFPGKGPVPTQVELYRVKRDALASCVDTMGPPLVTLPAGVTKFTDTTVTPSWQRVWYRAVAWSADDPLQGMIAAWSLPSPSVSVLLPPTTPPDVSDLRVNEPGSTNTESLVSWTSSAPVPTTPLGPHIAIVEARDSTGTQLLTHIEDSLSDLPSVSTVAEVPPPTAGQIARFAPPNALYRLYTRLTRVAPADKPFRMTVKMIDPLGRIGRKEVEVPPMPALPAPALSAVQLIFVPGPPSVAHVLAGWDIQTPLTSTMMAQFTLTIDVVWPNSPLTPPLHIQSTLDTIPQIPSASVTSQQVSALMNHVVHLQGTQHYFAVLHPSQPVRVSVHLGNTLGQQATRIGILP